MSSLTLEELEADRVAISKILDNCAIEHSGYVRQADRVQMLVDRLESTRRFAVKAAKARTQLRNQLRALGIEPEVIA